MRQTKCMNQMKAGVGKSINQKNFMIEIKGQSAKWFQIILLRRSFQAADGATSLLPTESNSTHLGFYTNAAKQKTFLRNGLNDVQKHIRKGETGLVVFAGDVTPIEIMCHLPAVCEDKDIPYCYTPSRQDIGVAMGVKRGSLMVLIKEHAEYKDLYDEIKKEMVKLALPL